MKQFLVVYENLVTDDVISELINAPTDLDADLIARNHSCKVGLSEGNYTMYQVNPDGSVVNVCECID